MKKLIEILNVNLRKAKYQLRLSADTLTSHNCIVVWPDTLLTVCSDEGKLVVNNRIIASQWEPEKAKEICKQVTNGSGEKPVCMGVVQYYKEQMRHIETMLLDINS